MPDREGDRPSAQFFARCACNTEDARSPSVYPIIAIRMPETDVDFYIPIAQQVAAQAAVPVVVHI